MSSEQHASRRRIHRLVVSFVPLFINAARHRMDARSGSALIRALKKLIAKRDGRQGFRKTSVRHEAGSSPARPKRSRSSSGAINWFHGVRSGRRARHTTSSKCCRLPRRGLQNADEMASPWLAPGARRRA